MSLANVAIVGAIWSILSRFSVKFVGLGATLLITRVLSPEVMGEVGVAVVVAATAQFASDLAFGHFIVVKTKDDPGAVFHAFFFNFITLVVACAVLLLLMDPLGEMLGATEMSRFLPVMVLALFFERLARIPESVAQRDMRFKLYAMGTAASEILYCVVSVIMAYQGYGGDSIVWANVAQMGMRLIIFSIAVRPSLWLHPVRITWATTLSMLRFGIPISIAQVARIASNSWDRLIITKLFGPGIHGVYAMGRNLGSVPADNLGDAVADVVMPLFVHMPIEEGRVAVVRACHLVAILVYPLAAGLAVISPTLVHAIFTPEWHGIAMPLTILAAVSLIDPLGDLMTSFLEARDRPVAIMTLQISFLGILLLSSFVLGYYFGLNGACFGVGVGMFYRAMAALYVANLSDQVSIGDMLSGLVRVALAASVMVCAVLAARYFVTSQFSSVLLALVIEALVGAIVYVPAVFLFAKPIASDVVEWVRNR